MDWRNRIALRPSRTICPHNFRPSKGSLGKSAICILCICEKIDDFLELENTSSNSQLTSAISEIIHNLRLINTSLDNLDEMDKVTMEINVQPIIDTLTGLLKLSNDEIGLLIAQGVQKICPKIHSNLREYIIKKIVFQMKEANSLTIGVLECLRAALGTEECLLIFLEKFGQEILPKVFEALRTATSLSALSIGGSQSQGRRISLAKQQEINSQSSSQSQSLFESMSMTTAGLGIGTTPLGSSAFIKEDKQQLLLVIFSILELTLEVKKNATAGEIDTENNFENNFGGGGAPGGRGADVSQVYLPHMANIINNSLYHLKETLPSTFLAKVLGFLTKLFRHEAALSILIRSNSCLALCSALKRMLFCHMSDIQKQTVNVLINMLSTYVQALEVPGQHLKHLNDFPGIIQQVDLIHAISQTMATSDPELFSLILYLLDILHSIPMFKGTLTVVVESGLRIASVVINSDYPAIKNAHAFFQSALGELETVPHTLQQQIVSLFGKLPPEWDPLQHLLWAKLLLFCKNPSFQFSLADYHEKTLKSLEENPCSVARLKLALVLSQASLNCLDPFTDATLSGEALLLNLIKINCIPSIMVLTKCGQTIESPYVKTLLELLKFYPVDRLVPRLDFLGPADLLSYQTFTVEYENEFDTSSTVITTQQISMSIKAFCNEFSSWSAGAYMRILAWIRCNIELMKDKSLFDLWNYNISKIVVDRYAVDLSTLPAIWQSLSHENPETRIRSVSHVFEHLDLDACRWKESIGNHFLKNEIGQRDKLKTEAILVFYYFYCLYNMEDSEGYLCDTFQKNLTSLLDHLLSSNPQITPSLWKCLSVYFKTSLLIVCCQNNDPSSELVEVFETLIYSVFSVEELFCSFEDILTFCGRVFSTLIFWHLLPVEEVCELLDKWALNDVEKFKCFFSTIEPINHEQEFALRNLIIGLTAFGSTAASNFMISIIYQRQIKWTDDIEWTNLVKILTDLKAIIFATEGNAETTSAPPQKLLNLSNLLELSITNNSLFCNSNLALVVPEFFIDMIRILTKYYNVEQIGVRCLKFILKCLMCSDSRYVQTICLEENFLNFLGSRLNMQNIKKSAHFEERLLSFEIMGIIENAAVLDEQYFIHKIKNLNPVPWSIASLLPNMQYVSTEISYLTLLKALLRKDLQSKLIEVQEKDPLVIENLLLTIFFHAESLIHKSFLKSCEDKLWEFLYEVLCFLERKVLDDVGRKINVSAVLEPWILLLMSTHVLSASSPFSLSKDCLRFTHKWVEITQKQRKLVAIPRLEYQSFSLGSTIGCISINFTASMTKVQAFASCSGKEDFLTEYSTSGEMTSTEYREKVELVSSIVRTCSNILDNKIDWKEKEPTPTAKDAKEKEKKADDNSEASSLASCSRLPLPQAQSPQGPQRDCPSRGSSTCSESELNLTDYN